jgi:hypothetical protein
LRRNPNEWDKLAKWIVKNELFSDNVRWLIQIPRLYDVFKKTGGVQSFEEVIRSRSLSSLTPFRIPSHPRFAFLDIFEPLFEVTQDPSTHPELHVFLQRVVGFDSVDDESKVERRLYRKFPLPKDWNTTQNRTSPRSLLASVRLTTPRLTISALRLLALLPLLQHHLAQQLETRSRLQLVIVLPFLRLSADERFCRHLLATTSRWRSGRH